MNEAHPAHLIFKENALLLIIGVSSPNEEKNQKKLKAGFPQ